MATALNSRRNSKTESLHAGTGQETGMKWLLGKKNCLIIPHRRRILQRLARPADDSVAFLRYGDAGFSGLLRVNRRGLSKPLQ